MKNIVAISIRSIARHERDHCGRPELAGVIEGAADEINRLQTVIDAIGQRATELHQVEICRLAAAGLGRLNTSAGEQTQDARP